MLLSITENIKITEKYTTHQQICSKVIVAFNPTLENLAPLQPLTKKENYLFKDVQWRVYVVFNTSFSGPLANAPCFNLNNLNFSNTNPVNCSYPNLPAVTILMKPYSYINMGHGYYFSSKYPKTDADFLIPIKKQLSSIPSSLITNPTIGTYYYHQDQPHFRDELNYDNPSPYVQLNDIQGNLNTFYFNSIQGCANSPVIWNRNFIAVNKYFPKKKIEC